MQCLLPGDHVVMIYQPPNINLPNIKYALDEDKEVEMDYEIVVDPVYEEGGLQEEPIEDLRTLDIPSTIKHALEQQLVINKDKKGELDLFELPQMVSGFMSNKLTKDDKIKDKHYGWHVISGGIGKANSEANGVASTMNKQDALPLAERKITGINKIIYREFKAKFTLKEKEQNIKFMCYRCNKGMESNITSAAKDFYSGGLRSFLSFDFVHKILFIMMLVAFFVNRLICPKFEK